MADVIFAATHGVKGALHVYAFLRMWVGDCRVHENEP